MREPFFVIGRAGLLKWLFIFLYLICRGPQCCSQILTLHAAPAKTQFQPVFFTRRDVPESKRLGLSCLSLPEPPLLCAPLTASIITR